MNKKGFTLVEVISVIALLGLIIGLAVPGVMRSSKKAKERTLNTKIKNIEKAAILYGQDNRNSFTKTEVDTCLQTYCPKDSSNNPIDNCYCFKNIITVEDLAEAVQGKDENGNELKGYIEYDDFDDVGKGIIYNSTDESKNINNCEIQIYQKYGKIYAVYTKTSSNGDSITKCWID